MFINSVLLCLAALGHLGIWVILYNQIHATGWSRFVRKGSEAVIVPICGLLPLLILYLLFSGSHAFSEPLSFYRNHDAVFVYALLCWPVSIYVLALFLIRKIKQARLTALADQQTESFDVERQLGMSLAAKGTTKWLAHVPGNRLYHLAVERKKLVCPALPSQLDGLTITHLSDFHFTGATRRDYFEQVVQAATGLGSDLVIVTGDILDKAPCLDWIEPILSQSTAPLGTYYVLGNHDRRVKPVEETRRRLEQAGWISVSERWVSLPYRGSIIDLCGNELPWFPHARKLPADPTTVDLFDPVRRAFVAPSTSSETWESSSGNSLPRFRILLSHCPDQVYWAQRFRIDLMLAGHTHGGQIRLPWIGSIVSASKYGNAFSAGVFQEGDVVMHVTRGISGTQPLRINCPPEITQLTLYSSPRR
jgi:predicted MPP superfamily phosphohydrolase